MSELNVPEGWSLVLTETIFKQISTLGKSIKTNECLSEGRYPVVDQGRFDVAGYSNDEDKVVFGEFPLIVFGDHTRNIKWQNKPFVAGADGVKILVPLNCVFPRFFYYQLRALELPDKGYARHFKFLRESSFLVAPLAEQQQIAAQLDELLAQVDRLKTRLDGIPKILKRFRQSVLASAVSGKLTEEWRRLHSRDWKTVNLGSLIKDGPQNGIYKPSSLYGGGTKIIRIDSFYEGKICDWDTIKRVNLEDSEVLKWELKLSDILINRVNSIEYLGKCGLVKSLPERAVFESNIMRITLDFSLILPEYIKVFLTSHIGITRIRQNAKLAVNQASINQTDVKNCIIELPPIEEQTEIVRRVEQLFTCADQIEQRVKDAQTRVNHLTQSILAKAFRGELTADWRAQNPDLITGENSAESLLARIKAEREASGKVLAKRGRKVAAE